MASSLLNQSRDDQKSKTRPRNKLQIIRQIRVTIEAKVYMSHTYHEVIRLRNPTEDKRAFRRMLTSADIHQYGVFMYKDIQSSTMVREMFRQITQNLWDT